MEPKFESNTNIESEKLRKVEAAVVLATEEFNWGAGSAPDEVRDILSSIFEDFHNQELGLQINNLTDVPEIITSLLEGGDLSKEARDLFTKHKEEFFDLLEKKLNQ